MLLLVQTFGAAHALAAGDAAVVVDQFGNPLCITSGEHGRPDDGNHHGRLTDCCTLACGAVMAVVGPPPDQLELRLPEARLIASAAATLIERAPLAASWSPANPRAPPLAM